MESKKLGSEPAFPGIDGDRKYVPFEKGMSKRFYAACAVMQGMVGNNELLITLANKAIISNNEWQVLLVENSYIIADELLKQENK